MRMLLLILTTMAGTRYAVAFSATSMGSVSGAPKHRVVCPRVPVGAVRGTLSLRNGVLAAQGVFVVGDRLHVRWVDTSAVAAKMVDMQPIRDWTDQPLVDPAMSAGARSIKANNPVTSWRLSSLPKPATLFVGVELGLLQPQFLLHPRLGGHSLQFTAHPLTRRSIS